METSDIKLHDLKGADTPWQTSHPTACISECYDPQSGYETENEHEQTCSDVETDSYEQEINLKRSVMPLTNSDARMPLMNSDACDPEMSVITQNNFPESDPEKTKKNEYSLGQVVFKKVIKLKIPKLPISTSICEEHERSHTSYSQTEFDYEQQCAMYHVMDHVHWKSLPTNSNPLVSSPLQPVAFQSIQTVSHCSYGDCSCNCSFSQPIISHCHPTGRCWELGNCLCDGWVNSISFRGEMETCERDRWFCKFPLGYVERTATR